MVVGKFAAWLVLAPLAVVVSGIASCEASKAYFDWRVRSMCVKDGGSTVYETIAIDRSSYDAILGGGRALPDESERHSDLPAFIRRNDRMLREGYISIGRLETQIVRRSDGRILGSAVYYARSGGDFPFTGSAASYFQCPNRVDLERKVFVVEPK